MSGKKSNHSGFNQYVEPFLLLPENQMAYTSLKKLSARHDGQKGRLVYLYGPSGVGKTHLGKCFLQEITRNNAEVRSLCYTASQFGAEYAEAVEAKTIDEFRKQFDELDVFICEDLAALQQRRATANLLTTILDLIYHSGGRILLTSRKSPGELNGISAKLVNRCHGGTCLKIRLPGRKSRRELLEQFSNLDQRSVSEPALDVIAGELAVSPRELRALLLQMQATAKQRSGRTLDEEFVREFLAAEIKPVKPTLAEITRIVAKQFGVSVTAIRSRSQTADITQPRQCAMLLARDLTDLSLRNIADYFGGRNHSTVIHACNRFQERLATEPRLQFTFHQICEAVGTGIPN